MSQSTHPLTEPVVAACADASAAVARLGEQPERDRLAAAIREESDRIGADAATLVVVGEKKRGKSSLINGLVGRPGLLPVGVDVATSVHLVVRHADQPCAYAHLEGESGRREIGLTEVETYAALDPATQLPRRDDVWQVEIGVPAPLLALGLTVVDTPGVGGLIAGHTQITMATLARADALLFVVDGSTELTRSELDFLHRASERIATVYFVLTQIDKHDDWDKVLVRNRDLVREHAPRYEESPWFPVSSRDKSDADAATEAGEHALAARRLDSSGFAALLGAIDEGVARRAQEIRLDNALLVARAALDPLLQRFERHLRSLAQDPKLSAEIHAREIGLQQLDSQNATWRATLRERMEELERVLQLGFRRSLNDLRTLGEQKIHTSDAAGLSELAADLEDGVRGLWLQLEEAARQGIATVSAEVACNFNGADSAAGRELELPERVRALPEPIRQTRDDKGVLATVERAMPHGGAGLLTFVVLAAITGGVLLPAAAGIGVMAGLMGRRKRREDLERARGDASRYLHRVANELETEVPARIHDGITATTARLTESISERIRQERTRLERELAEHRLHLAATVEELARLRERATVDTDELRAVSRRLAELQTRLGAQ
ncbi:dynamin [Catellatospora sp. TT07R-123]|uniref:dynamin family protein n=1 Tax=Catellatospora sp. TT07R-123 TaxID=2733863 RepID=UPI001B033185|nr:dynamin family protein [Catellatospora sp. TT07R-123]GHJ47133.1 dynamin [Catellatospora sp. TT07R-123]